MQELANFTDRVNVGIQKWWGVFFYFSIFALLCDGGVSWILRGYLPFWRQILIFGAIGILFLFPKWILNRSAKCFLFLSGFCVLWLLFRGFITYIDLGFNPIRLGYAFVMYISGIPFFIFPLILFFRRTNPNSLFKFLAILGGFFGVGLCIDGFSGGGFMFLKADTLGRGVYEDDIFRYSFLAQIVTGFGVISILSICSSLYMLAKSRSFFVQFFYLLCAIFVPIGGWFSGSRQIMLPALGILIIGCLGYVLMGRGKKLFLVIALFLSIGFGAENIYQSLVENTTNENVERFTLEGLSEDDRSRTWRDGFYETVLSPKVFIFGKGLAYASGQQSAPSEIIGAHYENTFFARFSETGILGVLLLLLPCLFIFYKIKNSTERCFGDFLMLMVVGDYLLISFVSPNGAGFTSQISIFIVAGIYNCRTYFFKQKSVEDLNERFR